MIQKIASLLLGLLILFSTAARGVSAQTNTACDNRYLTLINPVRGRGLWVDNSIKPLKDQYEIIAKYKYSASWLLQYDALIDEEIVSYIKNNLTDNQEVGIFLEVSPNLATSARTLYPPLTPWYKPNAVFLSGYSQSERRKLIDTVFAEYRKVFGHYPTSVGAWWIDSYSLDYIDNKYDIKTVLIVANQKTTDNYGVWGQWWGIPYYPSSANVLVPAKSDKDKQDIVVLQWAQRDISKAYGEGTTYSNYSLQANDYTERNLDTAYFNQLANSNLDCELPIGQITVGLETGIESVKSFTEYSNQLETLSKIEKLQDVTMDEFSSRYRNIYRSNPEKVVVKDNTSEWILTPRERENDFLKDKIIYQSDLAFIDYFLADKAEFLDRKLPILQTEKTISAPYFIVLAFLAGYLLFRRYQLTGYYWHVTIFIAGSFLTTFLAYSKFGRSVFFGPVLKNIDFCRFILALISYSLFVPIIKLLAKKVGNIKLLMVSLPLSFDVDFIVSILRYTQLQGQHYFGIAWDQLRFVGLMVTSKSLAVVNQDFPSLIAGTLLRFDYNIIWENKIYSLVFYPLVHLIFGVVIYLGLSRTSKWLRYIFIAIMTILFCCYVYSTVTSDPRVVF